MVVRCVDASSCSGSTPFCDASSGVCRACGASDCTTPQICDATPGDPGIGQCVECVVDSDCGGELCQSNKCVPCTKHTDCAKTTGICDIDGGGKCAPADKIIYVNNSTTTPGVTCSDTTTTPTPSTPFCQVNPALMSITDHTTRSFISVAGNGTSSIATYAPISWSGGAINVAVVGPGKEAATQAYFNQSGLAGVTLTASAPGTTIIIDGVSLRGLSNPGVICQTTAGTPSLVIRDSLIEQSDETGIESTNCALTLVQSFVAENHGAIAVAGGTYDLENDYIIGNLVPATGSSISLAGAVSGTFRYNTVVGNASATGNATGVDCGASVAANKGVDASIVVQNTGSTTQFSTGCIVSPTTVTNSSTNQPKFNLANTTDYSLSTGPGDNACCIDAIPKTDDLSGTDLMISNDINGTARPLGSGYDVGADEAR